MHNRLLAFILVAVSCAGIINPLSADPISQRCLDVHLTYGVPASNRVDQVICRHGYATGYDYESKIPLWTAYRLNRNSIDGANVKRSSRFFVDETVPPAARSYRSDYRRSGYDRGHMAPSASVDYSRSANDETFYYTNMTPQLPGFNRNMMGHKGVWGYMESKVRAWVRQRDNLYVISGAVVNENSRQIGRGLYVPVAFYKIVYDTDTHSAIALYMPHEENTRHNVTSYITSIDAIERAAGIDLFPDLDDEYEARLEAHTAGSLNHW